VTASGVGRTHPGRTCACASPHLTRILLLTDGGHVPHRTDQQIASALLCSVGTVRGVRRRCCQEGLEAALYDKPQPGAVPKVTGEVEKVGGAGL